MLAPLPEVVVNVPKVSAKLNNVRLILWPRWVSIIHGHDALPGPRSTSVVTDDDDDDVVK